MIEQSSTAGKNTLFSRFHNTHIALFNGKRLGYSFFGALAVVSSAAALNTVNGASAGDTLSVSQPRQNNSQTHSLPVSSAATAADNTTGGTTASQSASSTVHVTVNGQTIPVPQNGSSVQTITDPVNGTQTTVSTSSNGSLDNESSATNVNSVHTSVTVSNTSASVSADATGGSTQ